MVDGLGAEDLAAGDVGEEQQVGVLKNAVSMARSHLRRRLGSEGTGSRSPPSSSERESPKPESLAEYALRGEANAPEIPPPRITHGGADGAALHSAS